MRHIALAITGASGAVYGLRLTGELLRAGCRVSLLLSRCGRAVLKEECGIVWEGDEQDIRVQANEYFAAVISRSGQGGEEGTTEAYIQVRRGDSDEANAGINVKAPLLTYHADDNFFAPIASGSAAADGMVICPCSMGTLGRIAAGLSSTLIERVADVMLKEGRPLLLAPREMPLSALHLENMLKLARLGARIVPPMPAFYHRPETLDDLVDFVVGKVLDQLGVEHALFRRWGAP